MHFLISKWIKLPKKWQRVIEAGYFALSIVLGWFLFSDTVSGIWLLLTMLGIYVILPIVFIRYTDQIREHWFIDAILFSLSLLLLLLTDSVSGWALIFASVGLVSLSIFSFLLMFIGIGVVIHAVDKLLTCLECWWERWVREPLNRRAIARWERKLGSDDKEAHD